MKRDGWKVLAAVSLLVAGAAGALAYWRTHQVLGQPGVKVVAEELYDPDGNVVRTNGVYLPETVGSYRSEPVPITALELETLPKDTTFGRRQYRAKNGLECLLTVVLMGTDRTSIHKPQYCLTGQGWRIDESERTAIRIERPVRYELPVMKLTATGQRVDAAGEKQVVRAIYVYWFVAKDELSASHFQRMWWMARDLVRTGTLQRWAYASCLAVCRPGEEDSTYKRLSAFIAAAVPSFQLTTGTPSGSRAEAAGPDPRTGGGEGSETGRF
jgi:Protein of unknown function (DUF3485)